MERLTHEVRRTWKRKVTKLREGEKGSLKPDYQRPRLTLNLISNEDWGRRVRRMPDEGEGEGDGNHAIGVTTRPRLEKTCTGSTSR